MARYAPSESCTDGLSCWNDDACGGFVFFVVRCDATNDVWRHNQFFLACFTGWRAGDIPKRPLRQDRQNKTCRYHRRPLEELQADARDVGPPACAQQKV